MTRRSGFRLITLLGTSMVTGCAGGSALPGEVPGPLPEPNSNSSVSTSVWDGIYTVAQAEQGAKEYENACSSCHSANLRGNSNSPSLIGSSFLFLWENRPLEELFTSIRTQMPTNAPNSLSTEAYISILAFIMDANQFPPGDSQLVADPQALGRIRIMGRPGL